LAIVYVYQDRAETICEWCGVLARLRDWRSVLLTLCDECDARFPDPPYPTNGASMGSV
jgi:hypothetical protein